MAEPLEKRGAFKLAKKDRVVAGYWLASDDLDKSKSRLLKLEKIINLRGDDGHFHEMIDAIERTNHRHQNQQHEFLEEFLRRRKCEQQMQLKARLERRIQNLAVPTGGMVNDENMFDEDISEDFGLKSVKESVKGSVRIRHRSDPKDVVDQDAPLRDLVSLRVQHPDSGSDGQIVHAFHSGSDVFVVIAFANMPMTTEPLKNVSTILAEQNDRESVAAKLKAVEEMVNNKLRRPFQARQNVPESAMGLPPPQ